MCSRWRPCERFLGLLADLLGQAQDLDLLREDAQQLVQALLDVEGLEQVLLLGRREVGGVGDEIGKRRGRLNLVDGVGKLFRQRRQQRDRLARPLLQLMHAGGDLGRIDLGLADLVDQGDKEGVAGDELGDAEAPGAARDEVMVAVRRRSRSAGSRRPCRRDAGARAQACRSTASFWSSTPIGLSARAAACAPAMDCGRPSPSGATTPGNSTALRVGRMISAPSGSFRSEAAACWAAVVVVCVVSFIGLSLLNQA